MSEAGYWLLFVGVFLLLLVAIGKGAEKAQQIAAHRRNQRALTRRYVTHPRYWEDGE